MPVKEIKEGIKHIQILDKEGNVDEELEPDLPEEKLVQMYKDMVYARILDKKAFKIQRRGDAGTYAPVKGEEGCQVGAAHALKESDWFVPSFREAAFALSRGMSPVKLFRYFMGDAYGNKVEDTHNLPVSIPIASQTLHATGIAMASNIKEEDEIAITFFGDGATSQGDFHGALNFAGVYEAPVIFFNQNNRYAISTPREKQTASETLAQKAKAYGIKGVQVDGNDVLANYKVVKDAAERARGGEGPTMIEALTYRLGVHTTSDNPSRYRSDEEVKEWKEKDPIKRFETYLMNKGLLDEDKKQEIHDEIEKDIEKHVEKALEMDSPEKEEMFQNVFEEVPDMLKKQLEVAKERERGGN